MELYITILVFLILSLLGCVIYYWRSTINNTIIIPPREEIFNQVKRIPQSAKESSIKGIVKIIPDPIMYDIIKEASRDKSQKEFQQNEKIQKIIFDNKIQLSELNTSTNNNSIIQLPWDNIPSSDSSSVNIDGKGYEKSDEKSFNKHIIFLQQSDDSQAIFGPNPKLTIY